MRFICEISAQYLMSVHLEWNGVYSVLWQTIELLEEVYLVEQATVYVK